MTLSLGAGLSLPLDAVTEKLAFLGRTGTGKTYAAMKLAESMLTAGAQIVVLDAVGKWYGLRVAGEGPGFAIPVFGGLHGDFPLEPTGGRLIADVLTDRGISAVLDVSQFTHADQVRFALDFAAYFFQRKKAEPSATHVFLEECQEFVPQNPMPGEQAMLAAFERLWKLGRNFGIGGSLISQRPQEINKKALNQTGTLFVFQMTGPQERKAIEQWVSAQGINEDIAEILPKLGRGEPHVWSPTFLGMSKTVRIGAKRTADVSATPSVTSGRTKEKPLTPIDGEQLAKEMAATVERAKADDPKELRRQIAELRRDLQKRPSAAEPERVEVPVLREDERAVLLAVGHAFDQVVAGLTAVGAVQQAIVGLYERYGQPNGHHARQVPPALRVGVLASSPRPVGARQTGRPIEARGWFAPPSSGLDGARQKILDVIAMLGVRGLTPDREMVARWLGIHPNGGRYGSNLATLRAEGYLEGFDLTAKGQAAARTIDTGLTAARDPLDGTQQAILDTLASDRRTRFTRESLAEVLQVHPNGGRYGSNLARLRTMGLIPDRGAIHLTDAADR